MDHYALVNLATDNLAGDYAAEEEALRDVRDLKERYGAKAVGPLGLVHFRDGIPTILAEGIEILDRCKTAA